MDSTLFVPLILTLGLGHVACSQDLELPKSLREISGVAVRHDEHGNEQIYVVADDKEHRYYRYPFSSMIPIPGVDGLWAFPEDGEAIKIDKDVKPKAKDLESIDFLGDEVLVLSESKRRIYTQDRVVADLSDIDSLKEKKGVGLEGLAVTTGSGPKKIAALWEGIKENGAVVVWFEVPSRTSALSEEDLIWESSFYVDRKRHPYRGPTTVFRAKDLVWWSDTENGWIFLEDGYLRRFEIDGRDFGQSLPLRPQYWPKSLPKFDSLNWEGLCWRDRERREVFLVNDSGPSKKDEDRVPSLLWLVTLPEKWFDDENQ